MTSKERRSAQLKRLISEINDDLNAVAIIVKDAQNLVFEINTQNGPLLARDLMAMAAYLHHFYTGIETIFDRISRNIDGGLVNAADWHRELLRSMTLNIPNVRDRVISVEVAEELEEYRRFRHMFRHAYAGELRWKKMAHLADNLDMVFKLVKNSLMDFNAFILNLTEQL